MTNNHKLTLTKGFTLIEVLLGLLILLFISVCIYSALRVGMDISDRFDRQKDVFRQAQLVMSRFAQDMGAVVSYDLSASYPDRAAFKAENDMISAVIATNGRLRMVAYYLVTPAEGEIKKTILGRHYKRNVKVTQYKERTAAVQVLIREEMDFIDYISGDFQMNGEKETMLVDIPAGGLQFAYAGRAAAGDAIAWQPGWKDSHPPVAVRMSLVLVDFSGDQSQNVNFERYAIIPMSIALQGQ